MPGLIEGAHEGHGLGDQFLRHIERTKVLVHLVDVSGASGRDPVDDFEIIRKELQSYSAEVFAKPQIVVANKIDALDDPARLKRLETHLKTQEAAAAEDLGRHRRRRPALLEAMWKAIAAGRVAAAASVPVVRPRLHLDEERVFRPADDVVQPGLQTRPTTAVAARGRRASVRRRKSPSPAAKPAPEASEGEGVDLLTPARTRRRGV